MFYICVVRLGIDPLTVPKMPIEAIGVLLEGAGEPDMMTFADMASLQRYMATHSVE